MTCTSPMRFCSLCKKRSQGAGIRLLDSKGGQGWESVAFSKPRLAFGPLKPTAGPVPWRHLQIGPKTSRFDLGWLGGLKELRDHCSALYPFVRCDAGLKPTVLIFIIYLSMTPRCDGNDDSKAPEFGCVFFRTDPPKTAGVPLGPLKPPKMG